MFFMKCMNSTFHSTFTWYDGEVSLPFFNAHLWMRWPSRSFKLMSCALSLKVCLCKLMGAQHVPKGPEGVSLRWEWNGKCVCVYEYMHFNILIDFLYMILCLSKGLWIILWYIAWKTSTSYWEYNVSYLQCKLIIFKNKMNEGQ